MQKIKQYYESGRYEYDLFFYQSLLQIMQELGIFEELQEVKKNIQIIKEIKKTTKKHLYLLQQYDTQDQAIKLADRNKLYLKQINIQVVKDIMRSIQQMNGQSYQQKLLKMIKKQKLDEQFVDITEKINKTIHDKMLRLQDILKIALFININRQQLQIYKTLFKNIIVNGLSELKQFRGRIQFINKYPQVMKNEKIFTYIKGSLIIINTLLEFNEIYKLISRSSTYSLKLKSLHKQIQKNYYNLSKQQIPKNQFPFNQIKQFLKQQNFNKVQVCKYCLRKCTHHDKCINVIKLLQQK